MTKLTLLLTALTIVVTGCATGMNRMPLEKGEIIIFSTQERAEHFRAVSENEKVDHPNRHGIMVELDRPVILLFD